MVTIGDPGIEQLAMLRARVLNGFMAENGGQLILARVRADGVMAGGTHDIELARAFGADAVLMDSVEWVWGGDAWELPVLGRHRDLRALARHAGCPVAVDLQPFGVPEPRRATPWNVERLVDQGVALICLTDGPGLPVTFAELADVIEKLRSVLGPEVTLWSGMRHRPSAGPGTPGNLMQLVHAGADGVLLPLGGVRTQSAAAVRETVRSVHAGGAVVIGTVSADGEPTGMDDVPAAAVLARESGVDAHLIDYSAGCGRLDNAIHPELLYSYSVALRGRRATWNRMAHSRRPVAP